MKTQQQSLFIAATILLALVALTAQLAEAGQGCPFDDGSCQEYCNQQGCNMGYCGHFAWIQCICRKCGDEWSWYDKVRYNPDKTVNQTELDSLKLNRTSTLILTSGQEQVKVNNTNKTTSGAQESKAATLTTLLIPDLSDTSGKLDLNDIPDENSDKFLDYLAKNHEKLVQATATSTKQDGEDSDDDDEDQQQQQQQQSSTTTSLPVLSQEDRDDEMIEIQISSSNNNTSNEPLVAAAVAAATSTTSPPPSTSTEQQLVSSGGSGSSSPATPAEGSQQRRSSPIARLLRMAVIERASEEID